MSQQDLERDTRQESPEGAQPTGHEIVDGVIDLLDRLSDLPVHEHVGVFEDAHARLRNALDGS